MFGNTINSSYMHPNISYSPMLNNMMGMQGPMMNMNNSMIGTRGITGPRTGGLLSSLFGGRGATGAARTFNFGSLLTNASKALGVVKEAIPVIKEVGPMMGNMRSMLKIASAFKDVTDSPTQTNNNDSNNTEVIETKKNDTKIQGTIINTNSNEPNFFL